jgi:hypothetical protein
LVMPIGAAGVLPTGNLRKTVSVPQERCSMHGLHRPSGRLRDDVATRRKEND